MGAISVLHYYHRFQRPVVNKSFLETSKEVADQMAMYKSAASNYRRGFSTFRLFSYFAYFVIFIDLLVTSSLLCDLFASNWQLFSKFEIFEKKI